MYISLRGEAIGFDALARESWGTFAGPWGGLRSSGDTVGGNRGKRRRVSS